MPTQTTKLTIPLEPWISPALLGVFSINIENDKIAKRGRNVSNSLCTVQKSYFKVVANEYEKLGKRKMYRDTYMWCGSMVFDESDCPYT